MIVNNNIKYCRETLDLSQKELGKQLNVSSKTVSGWETGADSIPLNKLLSFCNKYKFSIDFVLGISRVNTFKKAIVFNKLLTAKNLKTSREKNKLTQVQVAHKLFISQSCYSQYETGISIPKTTFLYNYAITFSVSIDSLLT